MDIMAERAIAIGINPDGRAPTIARDSQLAQLDSGYVKDEDVITAFTGILASVGERFRERISTVEEADPVTENLLEDTVHELEKMHWMFQAQK